MRMDEDGFYRRKFNKSLCIDCGRCSDICPVANPKAGVSVKDTYAGKHKDSKVRRKSTSGGIFTALAEFVLQNKGAVSGVMLDSDCKGAHHVLIEKRDDIVPLRYSKYIQSNVGNIFERIKKMLQEGRTVLFSGTSCQVAGLQRYLEKDYERLYCVDMVCRGIGSNLFYNQYLEYMKENCLKGKNIKTVNFRCQKSGWSSSSRMEFCMEDGETIATDIREDLFYAGYMRNLNINTCCFDCQFKGENNRFSDITVGDVHGGEFMYADRYDETGMSDIIINTDKGKFLFEQIKENLEYWKIPIDNIVFTSQNFKRPVACPEERNAFFNDLKEKTFAYVKNKYLSPLTFVGVRTIDQFYYRREEELHAEYLCAYGLGNTFSHIQRFTPGYFTYGTDKKKPSEELGITYITLEQLKKRKDIFVVITVFLFEAAEEIHKLLVKEDIPHRTFVHESYTMKHMNKTLEDN